MKTIASAVRFFVYSNLFISTCVLSFTSKTSLLLFGNCGNIHVNLLAFFSTLFLYGFHKVYRRFRFSQEEHKEERHHWVDKRKKLIYIIICIAFLGALSQLPYMPLRVLILIIPAGFIAIGYSIPFIKWGDRVLRLRDILWLKALWIALCYAWLTTFLPVTFVMHVSELLRPDVLLMFARNFLFVFAIVIPFDIRDMKYDGRNHVKTLPLLLGVKGAIRLAILLLMIFAATAIIQWYYFSFSKWVAIALCISAFETALVVSFSKPERPNLFFPLVIESSMILQWALLFGALHLA